MPTRNKLQDEELISLKEIPKYLPRRHGKKIHYATLWRWTQKGLRGRVLESVMVGGVRYTSMAAYWRFVSNTSQQSRHAEAQQEVRSVLYGKKAG